MSDYEQYAKRIIFKEGDLVRRRSRKKGRCTNAVWRVEEVQHRDQQSPILILVMVSTGSGPPGRTYRVTAGGGLCVHADAIGVG